MRRNISCLSDPSNGIVRVPGQWPAVSVGVPTRLLLWPWPAGCHRLPQRLLTRSLALPLFIESRHLIGLMQMWQLSVLQGFSTFPFQGPALQGGPPVSGVVFVSTTPTFLSVSFLVHYVIVMTKRGVILSH